MRINNLGRDLDKKDQPRRDANNLKRKSSCCQLKFKDLEATQVSLRLSTKVQKENSSSMSQSKICS